MYILKRPRNSIERATITKFFNPKPNLYSENNINKMEGATIAKFSNPKPYIQDFQCIYYLNIYFEKTHSK